MSDEHKLQASIKVPHGADNYRDSMINVRADTVAEFGQLLTELEQHAANLAGSLQTIHASANVAASFPGSQNVPQPQQQQAPAPQQPAQQGPGQHCAHGEMVYRTGNGKKGPWSAYFCALPKDAQNKCDPVWL